MARLLVVGIAFFLSGAAALVYQVVWQRILMLHTGIGVVSIALIVAAFMAGLGIGSHLGGLLSSRSTPLRALRVFAVLELAIGAFATVSCRLFADGFGRFADLLYRTTASSAAAHFAAFLLPTTLMGMSLPFLVRAMVRETASAPRTIALLYGVNVLGAALGALLAPWFLVRFLGMEGAAWVGAAANVSAALIALLAGGDGGLGSHPVLEGAPPETAAGAPAPAFAAQAQGSWPLWLLLYALSGFLALSLEVVWFRLIDVAVKSTAFTFGTVLCLYLLGLGAGSLYGARRAPRLSRPLVFFLDCQLALLVASGAAVGLLTWLPPGTPVYRWYLDYWRSGEFFQLGFDWNLGRLARLYALLPLALHGTATVLMGLSFGALQRAVQDDPASSGRKVGFLQAANIAGCTLGSLLTGLLLLARLGSGDTLRLLLVAFGLTFLALRARTAGRSPGLLAWALVLAATTLAVPGSFALWKRLHGVTASQPPSFIGEDASAVTAVLPDAGGRWRITVNGLPHSWLPYEGIHTLLGALPAIIHPEPREVLVVGLGSGETAWAAACRPETARIEVYEIAAAQPRLLREASAVAPFPALLQLLADPRLRVAAADGRRALARSDARYDIVQVDALYRTSAGAGNLYSLEFFRLCASRTKRGGLVCSQKPGRRVGLTFAEALPYALDFDNIVIGSNDPLPIDLAAWERRLDEPAVRRRFDQEALAGIRERLRAARPAQRNPQTRLGLNHDLFPRDEFSTPAGWGVAPAARP